MVEEEELAESLNDVGNVIKAVGTVISIAGALLMAIGFLVRYFSEKRK